MKRTITLRYLFTLCVMTLLSVFCGGNLVFANEAELNVASYASSKGWISKKYINTETITIDGNISMTFGGTGTAASYVDNSATGGYVYFRINRNTDFTVSAAENFKITSISFTSGQSWKSPTPDSGSFEDNNVWNSGEGGVSSVTFTVTSACHIVKMLVTYEVVSSSTNEDPNFTISPDKTLDCKDTYTVTAVATDASSNVLAGDITYEITPATGDFTFNKTTGEFVAGLTAGVYVVEAFYAGTTGYNAATATCTITVADPGVSSWKDYRLVTDQSQILEGATYVLVSSYENSGWSYVQAMGAVTGDGYANAASVSNYALSNNGLSSSIESGDGAIPFELEKVGEYYALKTPSGYVKGYVGYWGVTYDLEYSETCGNTLAQWTIEFDAEGNAIIRNVYDSSLALMYRSDVNQFKNYAGSNYGGTNYPAVQLYAKSAEMSISQDALGYGTYAVNFAYQMPAGVTGYAIKGLKDGEKNKLKKVVAYNAGEIVPALTPLLVYSEEAAAASKMFYPIVVNKDVDSYEEENYL